VKGGYRRRNRDTGRERRERGIEDAWNGRVNHVDTTYVRRRQHPTALLERKPQGEVFIVH
jgi:hypothetical protein